MAWDSYERAGVDRALTIAIDLAMRGMHQGATILDVGCSTGTISRLLSEIGYHVTGIDSDVVAEVQHWQDRGSLVNHRKRMQSGSCRLITANIADFLRSSRESFDVGLLLSVLHHFLEGYGYRGVGAVAADQLDSLLKRLCSCIRSHLYVEVPGPDEEKEMPPDPSRRFVFPLYFVQEGLCSRVEFLGASVATNGKPRRLYRVDLR